MSEFNNQLSDYTLIRKIGSGGMADVWMAERVAIGAHKTVAIKVLNAASREKPEFRQMFLDEARLSMLLNNSSIVQVFDAGEIGGECFMAMEWVDGINLSQLNTMLWDRGERLPLDIVAYIIGEILRALDHAHNIRNHESASIVHRDVSPQNVMLSMAGEVKLMDFGVARFSTEETTSGHVKGKLRYMSPEQLGGNSRDPTVDLFAVGAVLHEMLEGCRFRDAWDEMQLITKIMRGEFPPLTNADRLPPELVNVMSGLLEPNSQLRIGTARGALRMLTQWPGYRNAAIALESYVTRFRDLVPPLAPVVSTGSSSTSGGDVQGRISARVAKHAAAHDGSGSQRSWRGVNPSTGTTLDQLESDAIDDTNVGSLWPAKAPRLTRGVAALIAALGMMSAGVTFGLALNASSTDPEPEQVQEPDSEIAAGPELVNTPKPESEPDPVPVPVATTVQTPTPTEVVELPEPPEPPEPKLVETVVEPVDELVFDPPPPPKQPDPVKKQKVKVTLEANAHNFVYVKIDRAEFILEPVKEIELLEGRHTIYMRINTLEPFQKLGRHNFAPGHDYRILMTKPAGFKVVQVN